MYLQLTTSDNVNPPEYTLACCTAPFAGFTQEAVAAIFVQKSSKEQENWKLKQHKTPTY